MQPEKSSSCGFSIVIIDSDDDHRVSHGAVANRLIMHNQWPPGRAALPHHSVVGRAHPEPRHAGKLVSSSQCRRRRPAEAPRLSKFSAPGRHESYPTRVTDSETCPELRTDSDERSLDDLCTSKRCPTPTMLFLAEEIEVVSGKTQPGIN